MATVGACKGTLDALCAADMLVCLHVPLFTQWLKQVRDTGTRVLMIIDHPDGTPLDVTAPLPEHFANSMLSLGFDEADGAELPLGPPEPSKADEKRAAKAHAKEYRKERRGERRKRSESPSGRVRSGKPGPKGPGKPGGKPTGKGPAKPGRPGARKPGGGRSGGPKGKR